MCGKLFWYLTNHLVRNCQDQVNQETICAGKHCYPLPLFHLLSDLTRLRLQNPAHRCPHSLLSPKHQHVKSRSSAELRMERYPHFLREPFLATLEHFRAWHRVWSCFYSIHTETGRKPELQMLFLRNRRENLERGLGCVWKKIILSQ